ncbi:MAG TPA: hypothetical protein VMV68_00620, partial [Spirochaetia bacterium]|nr:hypothetical protein [Spirochaetia bacterium]
MGTSKSPFSMYARKRKHGKPVYYVRFRNLDGTLSSAKCSGETSKGAAKNWAVGEIETGHIPPAAGNSPTLNQWATGFFGKGGRYD